MNPKIGSIETGEDTVVHTGYPHLILSLPITPGEAYPQGTVLQIDAVTHKLEGSDLSGRVFVAEAAIKDTDEVAEVVALGAVRFEMLLLPNGDPLTSNDAITVMVNSPLAVI